MAPIPDMITPIEAYRLWKFTIRADGSWLSPIAAKGPAWQPGWNTATCQTAPVPLLSAPHRAPAEGCACGLYGRMELDVAPSSGILDQSLWGEIAGKVELAGKVIEHEEGYRAERARLVELIPLPHQIVQAAILSMAYDVRISKAWLNHPNAEWIPRAYVVRRMVRRMVEANPRLWSPEIRRLLARPL
jgi:hypothetical protein